LSDLIGFTYPNWDADDAVDDFMRHMENTAAAFGNEDILVTVALDGENAWEYYRNDGHDFLELLYEKLSASDFVKVVTPGEYFKIHPPVSEIKRLAAGSWIYGEFSKWINNPYKNKGWEYLAVVRHEMQDMLKRGEDVRSWPGNSCTYARAAIGIGGSAKTIPDTSTVCTGAYVQSLYVIGQARAALSVSPDHSLEAMGQSTLCSRNFFVLSTKWT
jgi:hypothetical protein